MVSIMGHHADGPLFKPYYRYSFLNYHLKQIANIFWKWSYPKNQTKYVPAFKVKSEYKVDNLLQNHVLYIFHQNFKIVIEIVGGVN